MSDAKTIFSFTDSERAFHTEMRSITTDAQGREHLVGLTFEETIWYVTYSRGAFALRIAGRRSRSDSKKYLALHDKHECARLQVLGAEMALRNDNPTRH